MTTQRMSQQQRAQHNASEAARLFGDLLAQTPIGSRWVSRRPNARIASTVLRHTLYGGTAYGDPEVVQPQLVMRRMAGSIWNCHPQYLLDGWLRIYPDGQVD